MTKLALFYTFFFTFICFIVCLPLFERFYIDDNNLTVFNSFETVSFSRLEKISSGSDFICDYDVYSVSFLCEPLLVCKPKSKDNQ